MNHAAAELRHAVEAVKLKADYPHLIEDTGNGYPGRAV